MTRIARSRALLVSLLLAPWLVAACSFSSGLRLVNDTSRLVTPFPVVTTPPPPHREKDPSGEVPPGTSTALDPAGFNPLFHAEGIVAPGLPNALSLQFDLYTADPAQILVRLLHYPGIPGQEGNDPALQPVVLRETLVDVPDEDHEVRLFEAPSDTPGVVTWEVEVRAVP